MFSRELVEALNREPERPWAELRKGKELTGIRLAELLRPYGIRPRTIWIGEESAKGYLKEDFLEAFRRYITQAQLEALLEEPKPERAGSDGGGGKR